MPSSTTIHITALDGIVNTNSLFTFAVFIGLAWNPYDTNISLIEEPNCFPPPSMAENLVSFHVYSFSSFLFSSLLALGLKQMVNIYKISHFHPHDFFYGINKYIFRAGLFVSSVGSVCGCGFLTMAIVNVVQIKLGTLACGSFHSLGAVIPLVIFVPFGLLFYVGVVLYAFFG